jgi:hypothetical protein
MSRYIDRDNPAIHPAARSNESLKSPAPAGSAVAEVAELIDQASAGKPTMAQFFDRLGNRGVTAIPSVNARGLNGMSYRFRGKTIKGSDIGRAYTARGLQDRKGVQFSPGRDGIALAVARARTDASNDRSLIVERDQSNWLRDRRDGLSRDQWATVLEVGRFRAVSPRDLIRYRYAGNERRFEYDLRALIDAGLMERKSASDPRSDRFYDVLVLTPEGRNAARTAARRDGSEQTFYAGFVKRAEVKHDIGIYRMYQHEREQIEASGGRVTRIVMDFEIKKRLMSELNRRGEDPRDSARKLTISERHGIALHGGRFVIPDVRVEYETRDQEHEKVDLELATGNYKSSQIAAKSAAGLKIYGPDSSSGGTPWEPVYSVSLLSI